MDPDLNLTPAALAPAVERLWPLSGAKLRALLERYDPAQGTPVFTVEGRYTARGWTEWTQGFVYGSALLQFDATGDAWHLAAGRDGTRDRMAVHVTHVGVHDHGFNNVSTYGALRRLMLEGRVEADPWCLAFCEMALKASGAVQARRWTPIAGGGGFIHSFNGPHSLFVDTMRSLRALALAHRLGHRLMEEGDRPVSLLARLVDHARATFEHAVFKGGGRDVWDVRGRCAQESVFDTVSGAYRCPATQQGWSPFTTWTRGLAWVMLGAAEELEFLATLTDAALEPVGGRDALEGLLLEMARATSDYYLAQTAADGVPYWDTGAPDLAALGDWRGRPADPFNDHEPVDSSAAAIAAQGLIRLGHALSERGDADGATYTAAGLTVLRTLLDEPYLSTDGPHEGLLLHSVYHRPNGWDPVPAGRKVPCGEASLWGDYHLREAALLVRRLARGEPYLTFFGPTEPASDGKDLA